MGRALKIRKYNDDAINGNEVDYGFPNNGSTDNSYNSDQPGIVGGVNENSDQIRCYASILVKGNGTITASTGSSTVTGTGTNFATDALNSGGSQIWISDGQGGYNSLGFYDSTTNNTSLSLGDPANFNVTNSQWYYTAYGYSSIVRQKGSRTFLVAATDYNIQDESIAAGQAYMIASVSNTDWAALGADPTAGEYDIFTATKSGHGLATNGTVWAVGQCILVDDGTPTDPNTMRVEIFNDGDTYYASRLKNKFSTDFQEPYDNCNPGVTYSATFFNDNGNTIPDPAAANDLVYTLVGTENWC